MMAASTLKRALNYSSTYVLLIKDFLAYLGAKAIPIMSGVVAAGLLYPIPFAVMATAVYAMLADHHTSVIRLDGWKFEVDVDSAFLYALVFAGLTLTFDYFAGRAALRATTSWQTSLLWRAINQLPTIAQWDTETVIPIPPKVERLGTFLTSIVRSGFLIGRVVAIGLSNFFMALGALLVLTWLDPISVAVLIVIALLFLPLYAWAVLGTINVRGHRARNRQQEQALLGQVLEQGVLAGSGRRIDTGRLAEHAHRFTSGYSIMNDQLQALNVVSLILSLHVFCSIAIIYVINGASLSAFVRDKVVFFVILIFMLRSALGLGALVARLSRGYTDLAVLRAYLHPRRKRAKKVSGAPPDAYFALDTKRADRHYLSTGSVSFVIMPNASYALELLPLSNALQIIEEPERTALRYVAFLESSELEAILDNHAPQPPASEVKISGDKQVLQLPVRYAAPNPERLFVVALSLPAWELLVRRGQVATFCSQRIVLVILSEATPRPKPPSPQTLLIVSDGADIVAAGEFNETWDKYAEETFQRASTKEVKEDLDVSELV